jgi:hypothetical protein
MYDLCSTRTNDPRKLTDVWRGHWDLLFDVSTCQVMYCALMHFDGDIDMIRSAGPDLLGSVHDKGLPLKHIPEIRGKKKNWLMQKKR